MGPSQVLLLGVALGHLGLCLLVLLLEVTPTSCQAVWSFLAPDHRLGPAWSQMGPKSISENSCRLAPSGTASLCSAPSPILSLSDLLTLSWDTATAATLGTGHLLPPSGRSLRLHHPLLSRGKFSQ